MHKIVNKVFLFFNIKNVQYIFDFPLIFALDLPRIETNNAPHSFLSLELVETNIYSALLLLLVPGPTLTVSEMRSFWESLTDAILYYCLNSSPGLRIVLQSPVKYNFNELYPDSFVIIN